MASFKSALVILAAALLATSCNQRHKPVANEIMEGTVIYEVTYPGQLAAHNLFFLYPEQVKLHFDDGNQRLSVKGGMGLFNLELLFNHASNNFYALLNVLEKKMYLSQDIDSNFFNSNGHKLDIISHDKENNREIAGFNCNMLTLTSHAMPNSKMIVWYTTELGGVNPNLNTPMAMVPGIILELEARHESLVYKISAQEVLQVEHEDDFFIKPPGYEPVTLEELEGLYNQITW